MQSGSKWPSRVCGSAVHGEAGKEQWRASGPVGGEVEMHLLWCERPRVQGFRFRARRFGAYERPGLALRRRVHGRWFAATWSEETVPPSV